MMNKKIILTAVALLLLCCVQVDAFESLVKRSIAPAQATHTQSPPYSPFQTTGASISVSAFTGGYTLTYNVPGETHYAGASFDPAAFASTGNSFLTFSIQGSRNNIPLKIEIQTNSGSTGRQSASLYINDYLDSGITSSYQNVRIPLAGFANLNDVSSIKAVVLVFEHDYAVTCGFPTTGTVNMRNLRFEGGTPTSVRIDHFGDNWGWMAAGGNMGSISGTGSGSAHSISYDSGVYRGASRALRSTYAVPNDSDDMKNWCGMFMALGGGVDGWQAQQCDFSAFSRLSFWVRAASDSQNPRMAKLEIEYGTNGKVGIQINNITTSWQYFSIPLSSLTELDASRIKQINLIYERYIIADQNGSMNGILYVDDLSFTN